MESAEKNKIAAVVMLEKRIVEIKEENKKESLKNYLEYVMSKSEINQSELYALKKMIYAA